MIECCEQAELTLSQEKRQSDNNGRSNTCYNNVAKGVDGWFSSEEKESELEMIECCEQAELTLSQEKRRSDNNGRSNTCCNNVAKGVDGWFSSEEKESELEMIECCEQAELTLSQEKRRSDNNGRSNTYYNNVTKGVNVDGWFSSEEKESELEMIECCEQAELTLSQEKRRSDTNRSNTGTCYNNVIKGVDVDEYCSYEEKESELEMIECCERAELTLHQSEKRRCRNKDCTSNYQEKEEVCKQVELSECQVLSDKVPVCKKTGNSDYSPNMFGLFGITSSDEEKMDSCFDREMECYNRRSYFTEMPDEMLENIFCQLPLVDLLLSLSLVCTRWHRIISNKKFLVWKKRYYRYKYSFDSRKEINDLLAEAQLHIPPIFPSQLCR